MNMVRRLQPASTKRTRTIAYLSVTCWILAPGKTMRSKVRPRFWQIKVTIRRPDLSKPLSCAQPSTPHTQTRSERCNARSIRCGTDVWNTRRLPSYTCALRSYDQKFQVVPLLGLRVYRTQSSLYSAFMTRLCA